MTEDEREHGPQEESDEAPRPWWYGGAEGLPDVESLLGPDGMEAVGGVAEEALKLFVVLRDRVSETGLANPPAAAPGAAGGWGAVVGQLASGAVRAVNEFAAAAASEQSSGAWAAATAPAASDHTSAQAVLPGQAAACSYCPVCQAIALFRSVPMSTWQRLAATVVDVADAARDSATAGASAPVVVTPDDADPGQDPIEEFLRNLDLP